MSEQVRYFRSMFHNNAGCMEPQTMFETPMQRRGRPAFSRDRRRSGPRKRNDETPRTRSRDSATMHGVSDRRSL